MAEKPENIQKRIELKQREVQQTQLLLDLERQRIQNASALGLSLEEQRESYKKQLDLERKALGQENSILSLLQRKSAILSKELEDKITKGNLTAQEEANLRAQVAATEALVANTYEENRALERSLSLRERANTQVQKLRDNTKSLISTLTGIDTKWQETFIGSFAMAAREMGSFRAATGAAFGAAAEATSFGNILGSTMMKVQEATMGMVFALDEASVAFRKATGAGTEYNSRIMSVFESNRRFGISLQDSAQSFQALYTGMSNFSGYGAAFQGDLAAVGSMLSKVGVDSSTFAANMDVMTKSFGMSAGQARQFSMDFAELGSTIGIPPERLAKELNALTPRMAMFARTATTELRRLAAQSKSTGIEMQRLVGIAQGFDTFEGAAQSVGQLNALLGGPLLNTMQMMMATDSERIQIMKQAISSTGMMGQVMSGTDAKARMLRKALADVGGFAGDVDAMMRILGNDLNEFSGDAMNATGSLGSLQQKAMDNTTTMEKLANLMSYFAIQVNNLLKLLHPLIDAVIGFADATGNFFIPAVMGAKMAVGGALKVISRFAGTLFSAGSGLASVGTGATAAAASTTGLATAAGVAAIPLLAFGAAVALVGGGIWAAGNGIMNMAKGFKMMSDVDVSGLVTSVTRMASATREFGSVSGRASTNMKTFLSSLSARGGNINEASTAMLRVSSGIGALSSALDNFSADKADILNSTFVNLSNTLAASSIEDSTNNLYRMASAASQVAVAIDKIDPSKVNVMDQVAGGIKATVDSAVQLSAAPEAVAATQRIASAAARYAAAVNEARNLKDPLKDLIDTIRTSVTGGEASSSGGGGRGGVRSTANLTIKIGDTNFTTAVMDVLDNGVFNLRK